MDCQQLGKGKMGGKEKKFFFFQYITHRQGISLPKLSHLNLKKPLGDVSSSSLYRGDSQWLRKMKELAQGHTGAMSDGGPQLIPNTPSHMQRRIHRSKDLNFSSNNPPITQTLPPVAFNNRNLKQKVNNH